jgi:hypothetical protein
MSGAGSPGQQVCTGNFVRSMFAPCQTVSWHGAEDTVFGRMVIAVLSSGSLSSASRNPSGGSGWRSAASVSPSARRSSGARPIPAATRSTVPNRLTSTGIAALVPSVDVTFSNSTAGPCSASRRVWISVISSTVETGCDTRTSRPVRSSVAMKSRSEA